MKERPFRITDMLALLTLAVFALCILLVLLTGASFYRDLVDRGETTYTHRTALQYLATRVQQAQIVKSGELADCPALILEETLGEEIYTTHIYCYEGWLRELYTVPGAELDPNDGEKLLEAQGFSLSRQEKLLTVTLGEDSLFLYLPAGSEVAP